MYVASNLTKIGPISVHTIIQPSHIISTYGPDMAQHLPYHSHIFSLVRIIQFLASLNDVYINGLLKSSSEQVALKAKKDKNKGQKEGL